MQLVTFSTINGLAFLQISITMNFVVAFETDDIKSILESCIVTNENFNDIECLEVAFRQLTNLAETIKNKTEDCKEHARLIRGDLCFLGGLIQPNFERNVFITDYMYNGNEISRMIGDMVSYIQCLKGMIKCNNDLEDYDLDLDNLYADLINLIFESEMMELKQEFWKISTTIRRGLARL